MKIIENVKLTPTVSPFGENMNTNIPSIKLMAEEFVKLEEYKDKIVNLFCMGSSGSICATLFLMNVPNECYIYAIKKDGEESYSSETGTLHYNPNDDSEFVNIIIDDHVATGKTLNQIYDKVQLLNEGRGKKIPIDIVMVSGPMDGDLLSFEVNVFICQHFREAVLAPKLRGTMHPVELMLKKMFGSSVVRGGQRTKNTMRIATSLEDLFGDEE
jgi:hypothetical protein